jgi:hypothetical protein
MATEASRGQDGLHILIEIKMLAGCEGRLGTMTTRCGNQDDDRQQSINRRPKGFAGMTRLCLELG